MDYQTARIKQRVEQFLLSPLVLMGRVIGLFYKIDNPSGIFLIFSRYDAGGSMKVNADVAKIIAKHQPLIVFTKKPKDGTFRALYDIEGVKILDIAKQIDNKLIHFMNAIWRGILATWINRHDAPIVFGGEAIYFYKLLPYLRKETKRFEIIHVNKWMNYNQSFIPFMDKRIFTAKKVMRDYQAHYKQSGVPNEYAKKLEFVENFVDMPSVKPSLNKHIHILFIGRNSPQKRPHLAFEIAERVTKSNPKIKFTFVGDLEEYRSKETESIKIRTDISKQEQLQELYETHDALLLTSLFEGLPIVVMDMMANGRVVISTPVDGLLDNVEHMKSGILFSEVINESKVVDEGVNEILNLNNHSDLRVQLGNNARQHAEECFSYETFRKKYWSFFEKEYLVNRKF